jgi:hypothetical protein
VLGTTGLSSYWRLGEAPGAGTAAAEQGSVTGSYGAGVTLGQPGLLTGDSNTAAGVSGGSGSLIGFGDAFDFAGARKFSLETWVKASSTDIYARRILSKELSNAAGLQGWFLASLNTRLQFTRLLNGNYESVSGPPLQANTRTHLVITFDGTTLRMYINGTLIASSPSSQGMLDTSAAFTIGAKAGGGGGFDGTIDEPSVYDNTVLTPAQIDTHYRAGVGS